MREFRLRPQLPPMRQFRRPAPGKPMAKAPPLLPTSPLPHPPPASTPFGAHTCHQISIWDPPRQLPPQPLPLHLLLAPLLPLGSRQKTNLLLVCSCTWLVALPPPLLSVQFQKHLPPSYQEDSRCWTMMRHLSIRDHRPAPTLTVHIRRRTFVPPLRRRLLLS